MAGNTENEKPVGSSGKDAAMVSPYCLHPSDNPGMIISHIQLKGINYDEWARSMRNAVRAKRKLGFVDGSVTQPDDDSPEIDDWWMVNNMVVAWILNTVEPSLRSTVTYADMVKKLWDDLRERFSVGNGPRIQQLKSDIANAKQAGQTVVSYYGKLKVMWDELANYEPIPVCKCKGYTCGITAELVKKQEAERLHQFLMGLDVATFETVRSSILNMEPIPSLMRAYSMVVREERLRDIAKSKENGEVVAFSAKVGQGMKSVVGSVRDFIPNLLYSDYQSEHKIPKLRTILAKLQINHALKI